MITRRCTGCGAPLPADAPVGQPIECRFCGLTFDPDPVGVRPYYAQAPAATVPFPASRKKSGIAAALFALFLVTCLAMLPMALGSFFSPARSVRVAPTSRTVPQLRLPPAEYSGYQLTSMPVGVYQLILKPPAPYDAWDPAAGPSMDWAQMIGHEWKEDAFLQRIDVTNLTVSGTLDVSTSGQGEAIYRFWPTSHPDPRQLQAARAAGGPVPLEFWIRVKNGHAEAVISKMTYIPRLRPSAGADDDVEAPAHFPGPIDTLPLHDIAQRVRPRKDFAQAALFNGYLMPLPREGWVWYLNDPAIMPLPRIRARDGRAWPYDR